jgi:hypothetical protein
MIETPEAWKFLSPILNFGGWAGLAAVIIQAVNIYLGRKKPAADVNSMEATADKVREESHSVGVETLLKIVQAAQDEVERAAKRHKDERDRDKEESERQRLHIDRCEAENRELKQQVELLRDMKGL